MHRTEMLAVTCMRGSAWSLGACALLLQKSQTVGPGDMNEQRVPMQGTDPSSGYSSTASAEQNWTWHAPVPLESGIMPPDTVDAAGWWRRTYPGWPSLVRHGPWTKQQADELQRNGDLVRSRGPRY